LSTGAATGGTDVRGLETGFVERFGTGGEGWAIWKDNGG